MKLEPLDMYCSHDLCITKREVLPCGEVRRYTCLHCGWYVNVTNCADDDLGNKAQALARISTLERQVSLLAKKLQMGWDE